MPSPGSVNMTDFCQIQEKGLPTAGHPTDLTEALQAGNLSLLFYCRTSVIHVSSILGGNISRTLSEIENALCLIHIVGMVVQLPVKTK